jgi:hypothetical protein
MSHAAPLEATTPLLTARRDPGGRRTGPPALPPEELAAVYAFAGLPTHGGRRGRRPLRPRLRRLLNRFGRRRPRTP